MSHTDTFASTFSGFGGADLGAHSAGLSALWGIEYEEAIASVARANGLPTLTADVLTADFGSMETPYWYHTSPPCPSFSVAKSDGGETEADLALARAVLASVETLRPPWVSLENVRGYLHSESFRLILAGLEAAGYATTYGVLCAADYGTPQTRHRLFLVASRVVRPKLPTPTHAKRPGRADLFGYAPLPWVSWHEAVEDLLDDLPDAELAPWQRKRLPNEWRALLYGSGTWSAPPAEHSPSPTVTANTSQMALRAVLVSGENANGRPIRDCGRWAPTVTSTNAKPTALLVDGKANNHATSITVLDGGRPASTVLSSPSPLRDGKALLIHTGNTSDVQAAPGVGCLSSRQPANVVSTSGPAAVGAVRTAPHVRTVRLSPRCLARWQDFPDTYQLPDSATLACRGIGNAVPAQMMAAVIRANR